MQPGYHILEKQVIEDKNLETFQPMSILSFLRRVENEEIEQYQDYTIHGFEDLLENLEPSDRNEILNYIRELLRDKNSYLVNTEATFQIIVIRAKLEIWEESAPEIKLNDGDKIPLKRVFGTMETRQDDPNWFWHQLNIIS